VISSCGHSVGDLPASPVFVSYVSHANWYRGQLRRSDLEQYGAGFGRRYHAAKDEHATEQQQGNQYRYPPSNAHALHVLHPYDTRPPDGGYRQYD
jgi:hypothetical protein